MCRHAECERLSCVLSRRDSDAIPLCKHTVAVNTLYWAASLRSTSLVYLAPVLESAPVIVIESGSNIKIITGFKEVLAIIYYVGLRGMLIKWTMLRVWLPLSFVPLTILKALNVICNTAVSSLSSQEKNTTFWKRMAGLVWWRLAANRKRTNVAMPTNFLLIQSGSEVMRASSLL